MPGSGYGDPTGITVDDGSMEDDAISIGAEVDTLEKVDLPSGDASTVTVRANGDAAYKSSQDLTEKFISVIQQDARNIVSVKEAYFELDTEIKTQLRSMTEK